MYYTPQRVQCFRRLHAYLTVETVHLRQELIQSLLSFIIGVNSPPYLRQGIKFVDEDDRWLRCHASLEQVAHPRR